MKRLLYWALVVIILAVVIATAYGGAWFPQ